ncbi:thioesterase II family protein [Paenibacillus sp. Marseille-Q9583]
MAKIKLFCFPYAGGSAGSIYSKWSESLSQHIQVVPVELSGRGNRINDLLYDNLKDIVNDVFRLIEKDIVEGTPYAIFGHSMGSIIAYEIYHKIKACDYKQPVHMFLSAKLPPHIDPEESTLHMLPDESFLDEIIKIGGTSKEILLYPELLEIFLPILRADFKAIETYKYVERGQRIECSSTILVGKDESQPDDGMQEWRRHTKSEISIIEISGGHFFINEQVTEVLKIVDKAMKNIYTTN